MAFIYGIIGALILIVLGIPFPIAFILLAIGWYLLAYKDWG